MRRARPSSYPALVTALAACACEAAFVDPTPPVLTTERLVLTAAYRAEPVVFGAILDLQIPDPALCAATVARVLAELRGAAQRAGVPSRELAPRDLSPSCAQKPFRVVPVAEIEAEIRAAEADFPGFHVRPVLLYVNNVELSIDPNVGAGLNQLRGDAQLRGAPPPLIWGMALAPALASFGFARSVPWVHATDAGMWGSLAVLLDADLPLQTRAPLDARARLSDPSRAVLLKICEVRGLTVAGCAVDGLPCPVGPDTPIATATFPPLVAGPRTAAYPITAVVVFEACAARCERFVDRDGTLEPWTTIAGCVGGGGA